MTARVFVTDRRLMMVECIWTTIELLSAVARLKPAFGSSINAITDSVKLCDNTSGIAILGELCDRALSITFLARICSCSNAIADFD